ncbi:MAG: hypothetical protein R3Y60_00635 [bacterium]
MEMIIYIITLVIIVICLMLGFHFKIRPKHTLKQDKIIQKERDEHQDTLLYKTGKFVDPITAKYILRYTINKESKTNCCVVAYNEPLSMIRYYVYQYSKTNKLIEILEIEERNTKEISRDILLKRNVKKINIKVVAVNDEIVGKPLKKVSIIKLINYSIITCAFISMSLYGGLFLLTNTVNHSTRLSTSLGLAVAYTFFLFIHLCKRNRREEEV